MSTSEDERRRLRGYALLIGAYAGAVGGFAAWVRLGDRRLPERLEIRDLALLGAATYKLSRLISRDRVAAPLRAPFTEQREPLDLREFDARPRGTGARRALGELVACPFCLGQWIATALAALHLVAPRPTRVATSLLTAVALGDLLQMAHAALRRHAADRRAGIG